MSQRCAIILPLILLSALGPWDRSAIAAQESPAPPPATTGSDDRTEELVERYRKAQRELNDLRRELLKRSREEAQRSHEQRDRLLAEVARTPRVWGGDGPHVLLPGQPRLGITLRTDGGSGSAADGAVVDAVLDGGPADEAGLRPGDVITRWNDESLVSGADETFADAAPALRLIDLARQLEDGQKVRLTYLRDGKSSTVVVTARELGPPVLAGGLDEARVLELDEARAWARSAGRLARVAPHAPGPMVLPWRRNRLLEEIELVPLNPGLGEYFGTDSGLLVLTAPGDGLLGLRPGDVILSIGDRAPTDTTHVLRILESYAEGETINLHVMRKGKRSVLTATVPEREHARFAPLFERSGI